MDDKRCTRLNYPCLPTPGLRLDPIIPDRKKRCAGNYRRREKKQPGDQPIVYVKNPLFETVRPFNSLPRGLGSSNCLGNTKNGVPQIFFPSLDLRQEAASEPRTRKNRMKARAESRRDSLIEISSDEDYSSSINSSSDLRSGTSSTRNSSSMEDYNRRSRSARTERYFRRLSREENFHETYDFNTPVLTTNYRDVGPTFQNQTQLFSPPLPPYSTDIRERRSPNLAFYKRDNAGFDNPVCDAPVFNFNRRCERRREAPALPPTFKKEAVPKVRETENKTARPVRRTYSFQSEVPSNYETRRSQESDKPGRMERKWIDSIASSASTNSNRLNSGDFPRRKLGPTNPFSDPTEDETSQKLKSSKDFRKELSELEKLYTSLRLSDDNLLERAEERCVEENSMKGLKSRSESSKYLTGSSSESVSEDENLKGEKSEADVVNDDMAYRKMQSKRMPALSETQNSLSQISYLLASSALILDKSNDDYPYVKDEKIDEEPNITKDDMVYRNLHYANNVLKVVEPQPPFGIPLRPATPSTNSNYLCSSPVTVKSPPLKFVPQSEPNLVTDDLAFRNLRKDAPKTLPPSLPAEIQGNKEVDVLLLKNELDKPLSDDIFFRKKKRAVRSLSANLYGLINDVKSLELNIK